MYGRGRTDRPSSATLTGWPVAVPDDGVDFTAAFRHAIVFAGTVVSATEDAAGISIDVDVRLRTSTLGGYNALGGYSALAVAHAFAFAVGTGPVASG